MEAEEVEKDSELDGFDVIIECSGFPPAIEKVILNFYFFKVANLRGKITMRCISNYSG